MMPSRLAALLAVAALGCGGDPTPAPVATTSPCAQEDTSARARCLVGQMTLEEKVEQMHGSQLFEVDGLWETPALERLGLEGMKMVDGPRGVSAGRATAFPVGMARGATWDASLEERVGEAIGAETAAKGANVLLAPTMNVLRHPAWGRAQETYGEDTEHIGTMAVAFIRGAQRHVMASAKHFAANSIENTRFEVDVTLDGRTLREQYLPHFRRAVQEADVASVMSAYNSVNGSFCAENEHLLRDILKEEWGFEGFVESDWVFGTKSTVPSVRAGLDIEMPAPTFYGVALVEAVEAGEVDEALVDEAVARVVRRKLEYPLPEPAPEVVERPEHLALAREVARRSLVLLKNEAALPIDGGSSLVVVGALADVANIGDEGSSAVEPSSSVSPYGGLVERFGDGQVTLVPRDTLEASDEAVVAAADVAVVVVGLTKEDEGEKIGMDGGDRTTLALSAEQQNLVAAVAAIHPRTVVILEGGGAITMGGWLPDVEGVVMAWYPGQEGGRALADVLSGDVDFAGRLPISFPVDAAQLPPFDASSLAVTYGYFHGYRHLDHEGLAPQFPFGFGLAYTTFSFDAVRLSATTAREGDVVELKVDVTNTGARAGDAVVQVYVAFDASEVERAPLELKGFSRIALAPGSSGTATVPLRVSSLRHYDGGWVLSPGTYRVLAGASSRDLPLEAALVVE